MFGITHLHQYNNDHPLTLAVISDVTAVVIRLKRVITERRLVLNSISEALDT